MDDGAIILDHVHLFDARNVGDGQLLQVALQLLVVHCRGFVHYLLLPPCRTLEMKINLTKLNNKNLATRANMFCILLELLDLVGIHILIYFDSKRICNQATF